MKRFALFVTALVTACGGGGGDSSPKPLTAASTYPVTGSLSGLDPGVQVTLLDNAADPLTLTANGAFRFATPVALNASYDVTVGSQPTGQTCTVSNGSGSETGLTVNVEVVCASETIGQKLRRIYAGAPSQNTLANLPLKAEAAWSPNVAYTSGQVVSNGGNLYLATNDGISGASVGPAGTGFARIADGTVSWTYDGPVQTSAADPSAPTLTVAGTAIGGLTLFVPSHVRANAENTGAFLLGSNGVTTTAGSFLAVSEGPKIAVPIASVSGSGSSVTVTTTIPHNYISGLNVQASGFSPPAFNTAGSSPIAVIDANTYSYAIGGPASGAPAAIGNVDLVLYGNAGTAQDWFGSGYLQGENDGQVIFYTDAPKVSVGMVASVRIAVDDRYLDLGVHPTVGYPTFYNLDFSSAGGRKLRKIRVESVLGPAWLGAYVAPGDTVYAPRPSSVIKAQFVGDSFFNGNFVSPLTVAEEAGMRLGWLNAIPSNNGGSGFVASNYTGLPIYSLNNLDRILDVKAIAPDILVYAASGNDNGSSYAAVLNNMLACLRQARAWFPNMPIVMLELQSWGESSGSIAISGTTVTVTVTGGHGFSTGEYVTMANVAPAGYNGTYRITVTGPTTFTYTLRAALPASSTTLFFASRTAAAARNAVSQFNDPLTWFLPTISDPAGSWFTGSGSVANPKGDGNADEYVGPDGVHPELRGVGYLGSRIAQGIAGILPSIP